MKKSLLLAAVGSLVGAMALTCDEASPYAPLDDIGNQRGKTLKYPVELTNSEGEVYTVDSTGGLLIGELERLDQEMHEPLVDVSYGRDIDMREDVTMGDDFSSFTNSTFAASGSTGAGNGIRTGKAWAGKISDQVPGIGIDIAKKSAALTPWVMEVKFTIFELESAAKTGRPIDSQKIEGVQLKEQMDTDEQVYVGDAITGDFGLLNSPLVTNVTNVPNGSGGTTPWNTKTPAEILKDINDLIQSVWAASGYKAMPKRIGLPPNQFGYIATTIISVAAGNISILKYVKENNVVTASGKGELEFFPMKWLVGAGVGGTLGTAGNDRMVAYTKLKKYVRFPMTLMARTPIQYESIYHKFSYYKRLGSVEFPYPETVGYRDLI